MVRSTTTGRFPGTTASSTRRSGGLRVKERLARFPTQLWLTILWATVGTAASLYFSSSILFVSLISIYAIVVGHWGAHTAWKAERAALTDKTESDTVD